ncbi:MAG: hypothetical protein LBU44_02830 [Mediterranea sp.]|jgi:hypothetical protein|nr:hypothetical protein [Mediterranea sp.]
MKNKKTFFKPSLFVIIITTMLVLFTAYSFWWLETGIAVSLLLLSLNIALFCFMPVYTIDAGDSITVKRIIGKRIFKKSDWHIKRVDPKQLNNCIRTFASGGAFGYIGFFYSKGLGNFTVMTLNFKLDQIALLEHKESHKRTIINYCIH